MPNLKLRHKHRAAHPNIDPSSVPSLPLSLHTLSVQTHTRFKLKIEIENEPEPMELPECKGGSAIGKCKQGAERRRERGAQMCAGRCVQDLKLVSFISEWRGENRNCVFSGTEANLIRQALGSLGRSLCGTAEGKQRKDTARGVVDGSWEADQMRASVRDVKEKEVMCAGEGRRDVVSDRRPGLSQLRIRTALFF